MPDRVARFFAGWSNISLNGRALALSLLLAVVAGAISGVAPALEALRLNLVDQLKSGSRAVVGSGRSHRLRNLLSIAQISLAMSLVIGAALMCKGMWALLHLGDRYQPTQALQFNLHLPARYDTPEKLAGFYSRSLERLRTLPGVVDAQVTSALPYSDDGWLDKCQIENRPVIPGKSPAALRLAVSAGYFEAFHISLAREMTSGRLFSQSDGLNSQPVAVVSREFALRYFPNESALGHRVRIGRRARGPDPMDDDCGGREQASYAMLDKSNPAAVYMDVAQLPPGRHAYAIITAGDPLTIAPAARQALAALDPTVPLDGVETYAQLIHEKLTGLFYVAATLGLDALIALLLAAVGIFGVMANIRSASGRGKLECGWRWAPAGKTCCV